MRQSQTLIIAGNSSGIVLLCLSCHPSKIGDPVSFGSASTRRPDQLGDVSIRRWCEFGDNKRVFRNSYVVSTTLESETEEKSPPGMDQDRPIVHWFCSRALALVQLWRAFMMNLTENIADDNLCTLLYLSICLGCHARNGLRSFRVEPTEIQGAILQRASLDPAHPRKADRSFLSLTFHSTRRRSRSSSISIPEIFQRELNPFPGAQLNYEEGSRVIR